MRRFCHPSPARFDSVLVLAVLASLAGCAPAPAPPAPPPVEVVAGIPVQTTIVEWDEFVGRLDPIDYVEVRARVSGYLDSTNFREGQIVKQGDLLCVIDPRPFEAEVRRTKADIEQSEAQVRQASASVLQVEAEVQEAQARHDLAVKQLERSRKLVQQDAVSQEGFDVRDSEVRQANANLRAANARHELAHTQVASAESAVASAKALLSIAQLNLEYTQVRSPITGRISSRAVTEGNLISGGTADSTLITTIVSLDPIYCHFDTDEQSYLKYVRLAQEGKLGSSREVKHPVYVGLADEAGQFPHAGHMDFVDNRLDPETGTMRCRAILPNPDLSLTPGLFTRVRLPGSGQHTAVMIPDLAIATDQSEKYVLVIDNENKIVRKTVTLGPLYQGLRIVRSGLDGSQRFVLQGIQRAVPGAQVTVTKEVQSELKDDGLPTDSRPVPKEQWLSRPEHKPRNSAAVAGDSPQGDELGKLN